VKYSVEPKEKPPIGLLTPCILGAHTTWNVSTLIYARISINILTPVT